ncbi:MAG: endonuclease III [Nitrospirota bacterium]
MKDRDIHRVVAMLKKEVKRWETPIVGVVADSTRDPFKILISCLLSLRTKDGTTARATERLFEIASTPEEMMGLPVRTIEKLIYPVGFYRVKAKRLKSVSEELVQRYSSRVPDELDELLKIKGVGRKTANLVITLGYKKLGICVDTHVHRIMNRWGYVGTKNPEQTEMELRRKLPQKYWITINDLLVSYGQNICKPISPLCSQCKLISYCDRCGIKTSR